MLLLYCTILAISFFLHKTCKNVKYYAMFLFHQQLINLLAFRSHFQFLFKKPFYGYVKASLFIMLTIYSRHKAKISKVANKGTMINASAASNEQSKRQFQDFIYLLQYFRQIMRASETSVTT